MFKFISGSSRPGGGCAEPVDPRAGRALPTTRQSAQDFFGLSAFFSRRGSEFFRICHARWHGYFGPGSPRPSKLVDGYVERSVFCLCSFSFRNRFQVCSVDLGEIDPNSTDYFVVKVGFGTIENELRAVYPHTVFGFPRSQPPEWPAGLPKRKQNADPPLPQAYANVRDTCCIA